jgi:ABC-type multidrug transport system ATPase subunit
VTSEPIHSPSHFSISAKNLGKRFNREWIFKNLDFEFQSGKTYAITGPNGSGKSTLLQTLWGQIPPSDGTVTYRSKTNEIDAEEIYQYVSIAAPYMDLIDEFTLLEQVQFHFRLKKIRPSFTIPDILASGRLEGAERKYIGNFSSGLKQRIKLCLAFYTDSPVLFLDEPGSNLDQHSFEWYRAELTKYSAERIVFIASNDPVEYPSEAIAVHIPLFKLR